MAAVPVRRDCSFSFLQGLRTAQYCHSVCGAAAYRDNIVSLAFWSGREAEEGIPGEAIEKRDRQ